METAATEDAVSRDGDDAKMELDAAVVELEAVVEFDAATPT